MGIFLRQSHNVKPIRWGSFADVQYSIWRNLGDIYGCDHESEVLIMPGFWGLPLLDYSVSNHFLTNHGATYQNSSLDFDGSSHGDVGDDVPIPGEIVFISFWIYPRSHESWAGIIAKGADLNSALHDWSVIFNGANHNIYVTRNGVSSTVSTTTIPLNRWSYFATNVDSTELKMYFDGILDSTQGGLGAGDTLNTSGRPVHIMQSSTAQANGLIDEARIAKAARTADQIALFHDRPWDLYRRVAKPVWSIPAVGVTIPLFMQNMRGSFNSPGTRGGFIN